MIYFDVTKSAKSRNSSGLMRVNRRLREELSDAIELIEWGKWDPTSATSKDWYLCTELFDIDKREGFSEFLENPTCHTAAMFPDAIPLKFPDIIWPHSVARHPKYMHALSRFDHVFGISEEVRTDLVGFWKWQGVDTATSTSVLPLGADFDGSNRSPLREKLTVPVLVCVGIVEPRKNQGFLLDVAESLWSKGIKFELHIVGRVNPHFGRSIAKRILSLKNRFPQLHFHEAASDAAFSRLLEQARAVVFPTIAEGCGLPVLEALWRGLPCVCSDLPVLLENTEAGGCLCLPTNQSVDWESGLSRVLTDDDLWRSLARQAATRPLTTWADTAEVVRQKLRSET